MALKTLKYPERITVRLTEWVQCSSTLLPGGGVPYWDKADSVELHDRHIEGSRDHAEVEGYESLLEELRSVLRHKVRTKNHVETKSHSVPRFLSLGHSSRNT